MFSVENKSLRFIDGSNAMKKEGRAVVKKIELSIVIVSGKKYLQFVSTDRNHYYCILVFSNFERIRLS
jgi:hypothetical protein